MSAFGNTGGGEFEEEAFDSYEAEYQQPQPDSAAASAGGGSSASVAAQSGAAAESLAAPSSAALSTSPRSPPSVGSHLLSGSASAFDDEDDFASSPLHAQAVAQYAQAANVSLSKPNPLQASFHSAPPPLTINNGRDSVLSRVPVSNPLLQPQPTPGQDSQPLQPGGVGSSSASSLRPVVGNPSLPRIHSSPPSYDDSKTSLEALWSQQAATDPSLFTHAVYSRTTHFGKGEVHVIDPEKKGDGISSYIVYKVKSSIEHSPGKLTEATVSRRYSDFLWLHEHLFFSTQLSGFLVPPIPDKAVVGRFAEDFVEERRRSLEMFIKRVVAHPIVSAPAQHSHTQPALPACCSRRSLPLPLCQQLRETEQARVFLQGDEKVRQQAQLPTLTAAVVRAVADCGRCLLCCR